MASVAPPSNKAAAKPIGANLVMTSSMPIPEPPEEHPKSTAGSDDDTK
jgi:hypothetical protein